MYLVCVQTPAPQITDRRSLLRQRFGEKGFQKFARFEMCFPPWRDKNDLAGARIACFWFRLCLFHFENSEVAYFDPEFGIGGHHGVAQGGERLFDPPCCFHQIAAGGGGDSFDNIPFCKCLNPRRMHAHTRLLILLHQSFRTKNTLDFFELFYDPVKMFCILDTDDNRPVEQRILRFDFHTADVCI
jgi:hypothetical protein